MLDKNKELIKEKLENTAAQMRKGILEFAILLVISHERVYASQILEVLKKADLIVVEGTLYPLLSRLRSAGFLRSTWQESKSGPPRKYYTLSPVGIETLDQMKATWKVLSTSITALIK